MSKCVRVMDCVVSTPDLVELIVWHADTSCARVCRRWARAWAIRRAELSPTRHAHILGRSWSLCEAERRIHEMRAFEAEYARRTVELRERAMRTLRCTRNGVPTLLGFAVVQLAFDLCTDVCRPSPPRSDIPDKLWLYVTRLRWWLGNRVRHMPELRLPNWYPVVARDPLQLALLRA